MLKQGELKRGSKTPGGEYNRSKKKKKNGGEVLTAKAGFGIIDANFKNTPSRSDRGNRKKKSAMTAAGADNRRLQKVGSRVTPPIREGRIRFKSRERKRTPGGGTESIRVSGR